jgi:hypothetical protein
MYSADHVSPRTCVRGFLGKRLRSIVPCFATFRFAALSFATLTFATLAFATPTVTILSPKSGSNSGSPIFYEAYATSPSCANGISAMRIYSAPGVSAYTVDGAHIETFISLSAGTYSTVVQAWDNCGGVGKTTVDVTVNSDAGVSVFLPSSKTAGIPVHVAASAQNPDCSAGINAIRIYTASGVTPYTIDSNQLNAFVNLLPGSYDLTVQAWDNCGHVYKSSLTEAATNTADGYLYALNYNNVAEFQITSGVLSNPNGSGTPPTFNAAKTALSIAVDPGGWFAWVYTTAGIYGYQIDQSNGSLWPMPGSPFPLNGSPVSEPSGYLYGDVNGIAVDPNGNFVFVVYPVSNTLVSYQINRSTGAITKKATVTGAGGMGAVGADFSGQYVYAINNETDSVQASEIWGYELNQNNGMLTDVHGSPYAVTAGNYTGTSVSSTMLPSRSPASILLYALTAGPTADVWGYSVNYGTGELTAVPASPFYFDGAEDALADNQGKWVWTLAGFPTSPPQDFFDYSAIGSDGSLEQGKLEPINNEYYSFYGFAEDGTGKYLYTGGLDWCSNSSCSNAVVNSWTIGSDGLTALSGPLITAAANTVMDVGAAPKSGD